MEFNDYNEKIRTWTQGVLDTYRKDAELTIKYCNDLIDYGKRTDDARILGFAYYHLSGTLYCLNDCENIFDITIRAIDNLEKAEEWSLLVKSYNILGIIAFGRGNLPVAYDYYLDGLMYCNKHNLVAESALININCGVLNVNAGRYDEAMKFFEKALECIEAAPEEPDYHTKVIGTIENMISCKVMNQDFKDVERMLEVLDEKHMKYADAVDKMGVLIIKTVYLHKSGQYTKRDDCIEKIDEEITSNLVFMDLIDDFFLYSQVLYEADKQEEFWHLVDMMEPMISSTKVTSMEMRLLSIKIKYYRKYSMNAEYLQAAGLYYELSERREKESKDMMREVIDLRSNFEKVNLAKKQMEKENMVLTAQSETDPLTGMANRRKLNLFADELFNKALKMGTCFAIEILDVDYFKEYNDNYGHQSGDKCLIAIAECIKEVAEENNGFCARYGGDEFVIIYPEATKEKSIVCAKSLKEKVLERGIEHKFSKALPIVTISQGICCDIPVSGNKVWDFLHIADDMLYRMKKQSRNSYCICDKSQYKSGMEADI